MTLPAINTVQSNLSLSGRGLIYLSSKWILKHSIPFSQDLKSPILPLSFVARLNPWQTKCVPNVGRISSVATVGVFLSGCFLGFYDWPSNETFIPSSLYRTASKNSLSFRDLIPTPRTLPSCWRPIQSRSRDDGLGHENSFVYSGWQQSRSFNHSIIFLKSTGQLQTNFYWIRCLLSIFFNT